MLLPRGVGYITGCKGRVFGDCIGLIRCYGEESEVGKGMDLCDLGRNRYAETDGLGDKKGQYYLFSLLVSTVVWLCIVPNHLNLSHHLIKLFSLSWVKDSLFCVHVYVCMMV